jgi:exosome complex component MTR3
MPPIASPKLACVVHGPRPLPRSASFTPHALLATHVKFAPFAARQRRGYHHHHARDAAAAATERDLAVHVETALRGMLLADRWPKSSIEVVITVLEMAEAEAAPAAPMSDDEAQGAATTTTFNAATTSYGRGNDWAVMSLLASCITVASAAIADAGIDCVDLVAGGVSAFVPARATDRRVQQKKKPADDDDDDDDNDAWQTVVDPYPPEHTDVSALCVVGYMPTRDEITQIWVNGEIPSDGDDDGDAAAAAAAAAAKPSRLTQLMDEAVRAAVGSYSVLSEAVQEAAVRKAKHAGLAI